MERELASRTSSGPLDPGLGFRVPFDLLLLKEWKRKWKLRSWVLEDFLGGYIGFIGFSAVDTLVLWLR